MQLLKGTVITQSHRKDLGECNNQSCLEGLTHLLCLYVFGSAGEEGHKPCEGGEKDVTMERVGRRRGMTMWHGAWGGGGGGGVANSYCFTCLSLSVLNK